MSKISENFIIVTCEDPQLSRERRRDWSSEIFLPGFPRTAPGREGQGWPTPASWPPSGSRWTPSWSSQLKLRAANVANQVCQQFLLASARSSGFTLLFVFCWKCENYSQEDISHSFILDLALSSLFQIFILNLNQFLWNEISAVTTLTNWTMSRPELLSGERKQRLAAGICNVTAKYLGRVALVQSERVKN